jgi:hypothetical protein
VVAFLLTGQLQKDTFEIAVVTGRLAVELRHRPAGDESAHLYDADAMANFFGDADAMGRHKNSSAVAGEVGK